MHSSKDTYHPLQGPFFWGGGICLGGVCPGGWVVDTPMWTEFLTHAYGNITFPQLFFADGKKLIYELSMTSM